MTALSFEERQQLRAEVDKRLREKHNLPADKRAVIRERCRAVTGPFGSENQCRLLALPGSAFCHVHGSRME